MESDVLINKLRVIINHLPLMSDGRQVIAIGSANCMLDAYFLTGGKFIKTRADECMPPNTHIHMDAALCGNCTKIGRNGEHSWHCRKCGEDLHQ